MRVQHGIVLAIGILSVDCESQAGDSFFTLQDSAGVTIATSTAPAWSADGWTLSPEPVLSIGLVEGDPAYQLHLVRDAVLLDDGRIAIANEGSLEVRFYDASGDHMRSVGGEGHGPGEYTNIYTLVRAGGDSLIVGDFMLRRATVLDPGGGFVRTESGRAPEGVLADGSRITQVRVTPDETVIRDGPTRDHAVLIRSQAGTETVDSIARLAGNEDVRVVESTGALQSVTGYRRPFGVARMTSTFGNQIFTADGAKAEVTVLDETGQVTGLFRFAIDPREVTATDIAAYRDEFLGRIPPGRFRERAERALRDEAFPATMPIFTQLRADRSGNLWLEAFRADPDEPAAWIVLNSDGRWLGSVAFPPGLRVTDISDSHVLGVARDELDVEHVLLYELKK